MEVKRAAAIYPYVLVDRVDYVEEELEAGPSFENWGAYLYATARVRLNYPAIVVVRTVPAVYFYSLIGYFVDEKGYILSAFWCLVLPQLPDFATWGINFYFGTESSICFAIQYGIHVCHFIVLSYCVSTCFVL